MDLSFINEVVGIFGSLTDFSSMFQNLLTTDDSLSLYKVEKIVNDVIYIENMSTGEVEKIKNQEMSEKFLNGSLDINKPITK